MLRLHGSWRGIAAVLFAVTRQAPGASPSASAALERDPWFAPEELADRVRPSIVVISTTGRNGQPEGLGAGFIISTNGLIATCLHVIGEARPVRVELADGRQFEPVEVHAWDRKIDLAVLRIAATNLPALPLRESGSLRQGATILAMGNPLGLRRSFTQGVVAGVREFAGLPMIQLGMAVEPGSSGGPLLDPKGTVVGIVSLKSLLTPELGFAIPADALERLIEQPNRIPMARWVTLGRLDPAQWTTLFGGQWRRKSGGIQASGSGTGFGGRTLCLATLPVPEPPYEIEVRVRLADETGAAGLVFGADGADRHYGFYPSNGQLRLSRFDGPDLFSWSVLQQIASPAYRPSDWNTLKVRRERDRVVCFVNGQPLIESRDVALPDGRVGLVKFREPAASFRGFGLGEKLPQPSDAAAATVTAILQDLIADPADDSGQVSARRLDRPIDHAGQSSEALETAARRLEQAATRLRALSADRHARKVRDQLAALMSQSNAEIDLFEAALLLAQLDQPELDGAPYRQALDAMEDELERRLPAAADDNVRLTGLRRFLFEEQGFHGSRVDYHSRANSYVNDLIDDREGLPITLAVLFLELGRRVGISHLIGLPLPGHFMVKHAPPGQDGRIIDVFNGGALLTHTEADEVAREAAGIPVRSDLTEPASKREIIMRMLRNLQTAAAHEGASPEEALRYLDLLVMLQPDSPGDRLDRARLRWLLRDRNGTREDLDWLREHTPPGVTPERLDQIFEGL